MKSLNGAAVVAAWGALATGGAVHAQEAVQWRVEDGGNGHWYRVFTSPDTSYDNRAGQATAVGGYLGSITSPDENDFAVAVAQSAGVKCRLVVGGRRDCPSCPWRWSDGSAWAYTNWGPGEPNTGGAVHVELFIGFGPLGQWADVADSDPSCPAFIVEWSADCNGDGIVDYGQILDGSFSDSNTNGVLDCCEHGEPCEGGYNPLQWRVEDGGNGHWYGLIELPDASLDNTFPRLANRMGGHLATLTTQAEHDWVYSSLASNPTVWEQYPMGGVGPIIGLQNYCLSQYRWMTNEPNGFTAWAPGHPATNCGGVAFFAPGSTGGPAPLWGTLDTITPPPNQGRWALIEWTLDCNEDGIVDYGQIESGALTDSRGNGIPDECDGPWQWRVDEGGNGHWYDYDVQEVVPFGAAEALAVSRGGYLVSLTSDAEHQFVSQQLSRLRLALIDDFHIGAVRTSGGWMWTSGEPWAFSNFCGQSSVQTAARIVARPDTPGCQYLRWVASEPERSFPFLIEYSADCNGDGIVDYGQILDGTFADVNLNGVPDCCDDGAPCAPCHGDVNADGTVNGADISVLLGYWGQSGKNVVGDITGDGIVNGADLAQLLGSWGPCQ